MHLLKIEDIKHVDCDGTILWERKDIDNTLHINGELFLLSVAFSTAGSISVPSSYYIGMDNRATLSLNDTFSSLSNEPTQNGYLRQSVSSANGFTISTVDSNYRAISSTLTFSAAGGSWGPVKNVFLGTTATNSGYLLSSVALDNSRTVLDGQSITLRFSLGLRNC